VLHRIILYFESLVQQDQCENERPGLSISHDIIVKQFGGSIDVDTEPEFFTEFKIVLPNTSQG
jgi:sensor histidine kinase regulating citrate/malate metabolism